ncbi:hypothetical protein [Salinibacillus xinjiangensis]|uniref:DUF4367 domain-containing protein n=1 Tax=Salinibacillus xinjiangensis TaxID=1229268 RepID=A0A6G1X4R9_9BACI|nr:hypothetical protein [Salinibacillus xinjiangensis]MRG85993.1 hypothetical protein [Salinibacillus xinjiangensis]
MSNKIKQEMSNIKIPKELSERSKMGISKAKLEMGKSKRKWSYIVGPVIAAALALGIFGPNYFTDNPPENPTIQTMETNTVIDISNPREVVGFSDNVFVGKVIKQVGTKSLNSYPETQFEVEVLDNIKGELEGTITVNQQGGYEGDHLFLMEDDKLLVEGETYLFATRYLKEENWHTVIPVGGDIQINNEDESKELIDKYTNAY